MNVRMGPAVKGQCRVNAESTHLPSQSALNSVSILVRSLPNVRKPGAADTQYIYILVS